MKSKTRYNIRLADRKGVKVEETGVDRLESWYRIHRETCQRDRIACRSQEYFREQFLLAESYGPKAPQYRLLLAIHEGEILGGIVVAFYKNQARYLYGASGNQKRNLMPNYALQWRAIQLAIELGCETYDLFGIPPRYDPRHRFAGLYQFKTGFGGTIVHRHGCWDVVLRLPTYTVFRGIDTLRTAYYMKVRKTAALL